MAQQGKSQADKRRDMNLTDQFGREWLAAIDRDSFEPTGGIHAAGWTDPLRTPTQYLRIPRDRGGNPQINKCEVDFARWIGDQRRASDEWRVSLWNIGKREQKNAFNPATAHEDEYLRHLAGPEPWPAPAVLLEAMRNKSDRAKRLLGFKPLDRETRVLLGVVELEDLEYAAGEELPTARASEAELKGATQEGRPSLNVGDYQGFIAALLKRKIPMKQANAIWKDLSGEAVATAIKEG